MPEVQSSLSEASQLSTLLEDKPEDDDMSSLDMPVQSVTDAVPEPGSFQSDYYEPAHDEEQVFTNSDYEQSDTDDEQGSIGLFYQSLIWLMLLMVIICLWQLFGLNRDVALLNTGLSRINVSLDWLEESQDEQKMQLRGELNQFRLHLNDLSGNEGFAGGYGSNAIVDNRINQLSNRLNALESRLSQLTTANSTANTLNAIKGKWVINLASSDERQQVIETALAELIKAGIPASITTLSMDDKVWRRILVGGFGTYEDARRYAEDILVKRDIKNYWIRLAE